MAQTVAILGASANPERYANKAFHMLQEYGHQPIPINPGLNMIEDVPVVPNLKELKSPVDTLTMYVRPEVSSKLENEILSLKPKRVIFNPGTENPQLQRSLENHGIHTVEGCTLVLLRTEQFDTA